MKAKDGWTPTKLAGDAVGLAIPESGLREDVDVGRGHKGNPDDVGGEGRGASDEACLMQINPVIAWQYVPGLTNEERVMAAATRDGRERVAQSLVGKDHDALVRCFRTGMRMMMHSKVHYDWWYAEVFKQYGKAYKADVGWSYDAKYSMFSMYGSGHSCLANQGQKVGIRTATANRIAAMLKQAQAVARKQAATRVD